MTRQRRERNINTEKCCNEIMCCCMPCIGIFMMGENLCKGVFLWACWLGSCQCFNFKRTPTRRDVSPVITQREINEMVTDIEEIEDVDVEFVDFSEETKDASYI